MQRSAAATVARSAREIAPPSSDAPIWRRQAYDGAATRQLHFAYRPVIPVDPAARVTAGLLQQWLQARSSSIATARPGAGIRAAAGVLTKMDRYFLGHAASALETLQSRGFAGGAVVHLSIAGLTDPLLPIYVVSQLQRRGVSLLGVHVTLVRY